jgi:CzcA family heavy metal efflux pump
VNVAAWALRNRALVFLVLVAAVAGGALAATRLPSGIYPELDFPRIGVVVRQGSSPPPIFQTNVTRPLEQALLSVLGVQRVRSRTIRGGAELSVLFTPGSDMWRALQLVESRLNDARAALPADTEVRVERLTPVAFPILSFNLSGALDPRALLELAEYVIRPAIARVPGVGRVGVLGGEVREVQVILDPVRAAAMRLRPQDVASRIRASLPLVAVGRHDQDRSLVTVMASAEARDLADLRGLPVGLDASGVPVLLGAVATIEEGAEDKLFRTSDPRGDAVLLTIARLEGASTPEVVGRVLSAVEALRPVLPAGVTLEPVYDQGWLVRESIMSVLEAILLGIALCVVVLWLFLRDARAGFVAAVAVPVTLVITFLAMYAFGQTLNLMSLGGMAVAIGLVVDDAIVIVEAIARRHEQGDSPDEAARAGTSELAAAVIGTTLTTVIVFLPLAFLSGVVGKFFSALAVTLSAAVAISLLVALLVVPVAAARLMRPKARAPSGRAERAYGRVVRRTANHGWIGGVGLALALGFSYFAFSRVPTGFMPTSDEGAFVIDYFLPAGTSLEETDAAARKIEAILRSLPEVRTYSRRTGAQLNPTAATLLNRGDFMVRLTDGPRRHADDVIAAVRQRVEREVPQARVEFVQVLQDMLNDLAGTPRPLEVKLFGEDYAVLERLAAEIAPRLAKVPGLVDLYGGVEGASPELVAHLDRSALARLGKTPEELTADLAAALRGAPAGTLRRFDRLLGIRVRYPDSVRFAASEVARLPLAFGKGGTVNLGSVARLARESSPTVLLHEGLQPVVVLSADREGRDLGSIVRNVDALLGELPLPPGYRYELGGQYEGQQETLSNLAAVGGAGLLLVFVVLVAQFRRLRPALAVLLTTPLALVGALAMLWATQTPLNASSLMGCVLLVGLVVKNGILLIEVAEQEAAGRPYVEALAIAGQRRIRPIAMTTVATIFGLAPLALGLGSGAELQRPLALAVIGGLLVSAALSLVVLPALAAWLHGLGRRKGASEHGPG